jgi:hypothetical protein
MFINQKVSHVIPVFGSLFINSDFIFSLKTTHLKLNDNLVFAQEAFEMSHCKIVKLVAGMLGNWFWVNSNVFNSFTMLFVSALTPI